MREMPLDQKHRATQKAVEILLDTITAEQRERVRRHLLRSRPAGRSQETKEQSHAAG